MRRCSLTDQAPNRQREVAVVAPKLWQVLREAIYFLANPPDLSLISSHGFGIRDLHTPAALRFSVEARDDAESNEGMVNVLGEPFRCHRELDSRAAVFGRKEAA